MGLLLHAISAASLTPNQNKQLAALGVCGYCCSGINGLTTAYEPAAIKTASREHLLSYSQLIESTRHIVDIIPMRYGSVFDDEALLYQALARNSEYFTQQLAEIAGCVEMSVRIPIAPTANPVPTPLTGQEYLQVKQQQAAKPRATFERITAAAAGRYIKKKVDHRPVSAVLHLHFLVKHTEVNEFKRCIAALQLSQLVLTGPWAAYNFVN
jgi:hypothetical protein